MASDADADPVGFGCSSHRRPPLPIASLREKIVEKIQQNRVTLIVGETGCGNKSRRLLLLAVFWYLGFLRFLGFVRSLLYTMLCDSLLATLMDDVNGFI